MDFGRQPSGVPALESIFPTISPIIYIYIILFFGGFLWLVSKENVRDIYQVTKKTLFKTIGWTIIIDVVFIYSIIS